MIVGIEPTTYNLNIVDLPLIYIATHNDVLSLLVHIVLLYRMQHATYLSPCGLLNHTSGIRFLRFPLYYQTLFAAKHRTNWSSVSYQQWISLHEKQDLRSFRIYWCYRAYPYLSAMRDFSLSSCLFPVPLRKLVLVHQNSDLHSLTYC